MAKKPTYAERLVALQTALSDIKDDAESLRDDLRDWYESMPDSLQGGDKGSAVDEAADAMGELCDALDAAEGVSFDW